MRTQRMFMSRIPTWFLFVFLFQTWSVTVRPAKHTPHHNHKNIFILAGQSNMAGRGGVTTDMATGNSTWDGVVPPECRPNRRILRLNAQLKWVKAREPLHADIDVNETTGIGPGMAFANRILAKDSRFGVVGLVPCAIGGTSIRQWEKGQFLYMEMIRRAMASMEDGGTLRALLWYQGERDTVDLQDAQSYKARLTAFFSDVRRDLNSPTLPIIQVALASGTGSGPYTEIVRNAQLGVGLVNLATVDAKGFPLQSDGLHLTTLAQVRLGLLMADEFLQFVHF